MRPDRVPPGPGQELVWDYPRPPLVERASRHVLIELNNRVIAETSDVFLVKETSHPPVYFLPGEAFADRVLRRAPGRTACEWKGSATYFDVTAGDRSAERAAFTYESPVPRFAEIEGWFAVYARPMDRVVVDGEVVTPQPGEFYAGWITQNVVGPFKGGPGSMGW